MVKNDSAEFSKPLQTDYITGCCLFTSMEVINQLNGFDERFNMYGEDVDLCLRAGVPTENVLKWDMAETAKGGPFPEIVESDIFVNCIYLMSKIPNFVDMKSLDTPDRKLSVICDVSADTTNPNNPNINQ